MVSIFCGLLLCGISLRGQEPPKPVGLTPNMRQLEWFDREVIAFFHFGINTFGEGVNEGDGRAPAALFAPAALDCDQWMRVLKAAGITSSILTAKHADGFCLWPSAYTDYSVRNTAWREGKGDVVREYTDACARHGLKAGIYLGPHDRHAHLHPDYTTEYYRHYYRAQLTELMTGYGRIWETWWDGAGAEELTADLYRSWHEVIEEHQPQCVVFGARNAYAHADVRWVGNEAGIAGEPCWSTIDSLCIYDENPHRQALNQGIRTGNAYIPAETDVSIRPSWFYHAEEDSRVKSAEELWELYCKSVGRNSVLLINLPPTREGRIHPTDSANMAELRRMIDGTFQHNLLREARVKTDNDRGGRFRASHLVDGRADTYYAGRDNRDSATITFTLPKPITFDCIMAEEVIALGERTDSWCVEVSDDGRHWQAIPEAARVEGIGHKRIVCCQPRTTRRLRLRILNGKACPALRSFGVYKQKK